MRHMERFRFLSRFRTWETAVFIAFIAALFVLYVPFHNKYRTMYIDNAWTLSWAWNYWTSGEVYDTVFGLTEGTGGGSALFSRTYVFIYGAVATIFGWSRPVAYGLSTVLLIGSAALWTRILKNRGYDRSTVLWFVLLMLFLETYYGMAHKARVDSLAFFLLSLSFCLFDMRRYLWSGLFLAIAVETHPFAAVGIFWIIAHIMAFPPDISGNTAYWVKKMALFAAGGIIGIIYYLGLHYPYLGDLLYVENYYKGNALWSYYFKYAYSWRHWPELALILISLAVQAISGRWNTNRFSILLLFSSVVGSILLRRSNYHYVVFLYPGAILLILDAFRNKKMRVSLLAAILLVQGSQYVWLFWSQRDFSWNDYLADVNTLVGKGNNDFIYGPSSSWFALKDRDFHAYGYFMRERMAQKDLPDRLYVLVGEDYIRDGSYLSEIVGGSYTIISLGNNGRDGEMRLSLEKWERKLE